MKEEADLVTGEAVVLELKVARVATRCLAMMLDVVLQTALLLIAFLLLLGAMGRDGSLFLTLMLVSFVLVLVGYPALLETLSRGRTLGKMALGLRVVRDDGGPIRFRHALTRALCGVLVDFWLLGLGGAVALIVSLLSRDGKRVGDYLAGTIVIRERVSDAGSSAVILMPPPLAQWAAQLDLTGLSDGLALAVRQFLGRMNELRPEAGHALGYGLAEQVGHAIRAPLPPGVPAWAYLSAVLAERRRRDQARVLGPPGRSGPVPPAVVPQPAAAVGHPPFTPEPSVPPPASANPFTPPS